MKISKEPCKKALEYHAKLKARMTEAEMAMEKILKSMGLSFKAQKIFQCGADFKFPDFYLPFYRTVIEVDGFQHFTAKGRSYDAQREQFLKKHCKVKRIIRFPNSKVIREPEFVARTICRIIFPGFRQTEKIADGLATEFASVVGRE